jgi:hypothetical protein
MAIERFEITLGSPKGFTKKGDSGNEAVVGADHVADLAQHLGGRRQKKSVVVVQTL